MATGRCAKRRRSEAAQRLEALIVLGLGALAVILVLVWLVGALSLKVVAVAVGVLAGLGILLGLLILVVANVKWRGQSVARLTNVSRGGEQITVTAPDGAALHVEVDRPARSVGLTVIFLHTVGATLTSWAAHRALLDDARVTRVFYDARGHGRSGWRSLDPAVPGVRQFAGDLAAVIDAVAPTGPLVLVGHGLGGMTITALDAVRPDLTARVAGVLLCASTGGGLRKSARFGLPAMLGPLLGVVRRELPGTVMLMGLLPRFVWRLLGLGPYLIGVRMLGVARERRSAVRHAAAMAYENDFRTLGGTLAAMLQHDERDAVPALAGREVVTVEAFLDGVVPFANQRQLAAAIPGARRRIAAHAGHAVGLEVPELVAEELMGVIGEAYLATPEGQAAVASARAAANGTAPRRKPRPGPGVVPAQVVPHAVTDAAGAGVSAVG